MSPLERNLRLLPAFQATRYLLFWLPVFFLYFASVLPIEQVLLLEAAYYFSTVLFEVPSGWFSDRVGRRATLLLAMAAQTLGCLLFLSTASLVPFLFAQICLAAANAFISGTDQALLYDSLQALGREKEIGRQAERVANRGYLALAISSVAGGLAAGFDLRWAYAGTLLASLVAFGLAWRMTEPPVFEDERDPLDHESNRMKRGVWAACTELRQPILRWTFLFAIAMHVLNHVPYEFFQPYASFLLGSSESGTFEPTPAVSGFVFGTMMLLSAFSATRSMALGQRLGRANALLACVVLQGVIIAAMARWLHPAVILLVVLRSVPMGLAGPLLTATIQPRLPRAVRATFVSIMSFAGSLAFSATLFATSRSVAGQSWTPDLLADVLNAYTIGFVSVLAVLFAFRSWLASESKP